MKTQTKQDIVTDLYNSDNGLVCVNIFEHLCRLPLEALQDISSNELLKATINETDQTVMECVRYLCGDIKVLFPFYGFITKPNEEPVYLDTEQVKSVINNDIPIDLKTLFISFKPGHNLLPHVNCIKRG